MFFTYLRRELRRRIRQATFIALGLAVGIGLVITVTAASSGVKSAEGSVLNFADLCPALRGKPRAEQLQVALSIVDAAERDCIHEGHLHESP